MHRHEFADAASGRGPGVGRSLDGSNVPPDDRRHIARPDFLPTHQSHLGSLDHGIRGLDHRNETFGLHQSQRVTHVRSLLLAAHVPRA